MADGGWRLLAWGFVLAEAPLPDAMNGSGLRVADTLGGGVRRVDLAGGSDAGELLPGRRGIGGLAHAAHGGLLATGRDVVVLSVDAIEPSTVIPPGPGITG